MILRPADRKREIVGAMTETQRPNLVTAALETHTHGVDQGDLVVFTGGVSGRVHDGMMAWREQRSAEIARHCTGFTTSPARKGRIVGRLCLCSCVFVYMCARVLVCVCVIADVARTICWSTRWSDGRARAEQYRNSSTLHGLRHSSCARWVQYCMRFAACVRLFPPSLL